MKNLNLIGLLTIVLTTVACDPVVKNYATTNLFGMASGDIEGYFLVVVSSDEEYVVRFMAGDALAERVTKTYSINKDVTVQEFACGAFISAKINGGISEEGMTKVQGLLLRGPDSRDLKLTSSLTFNEERFINEADAVFELNGWKLKDIFPNADFDKLKKTSFCKE